MQTKLPQYAYTAFPKEVLVPNARSC